MMTRRLISFVRKLYICTGIDRCRYLYFQSFFDLFKSSMGKCLTVFCINFSITPTGRTRSLTLHRAKWCLNILNDITMTSTGFTCLFFSTGNLFHPTIGNFFAYSQKRFFEIYVDSDLDVFSTLGAFFPSSSAKSSAKNTPHNIAYVKISEVNSSLSTSKSSKSSLTIKSRKSTFPICIVLAFFLFVADNLICFIHFLKLFFVTTSIWMMFYCSLFKRFFDLFLRSIFLDSKDVIVIFLYVEVHNYLSINR